MEIIKKEDLKIPKDLSSVPQIDWGADFLAWDVNQQNRYLKKLCSALNQATDNIQSERNEALKECHRLNNAVENADKAVSIQKAIVIKAITEHNAEKQRLIERIQELEMDNKLLNVTIKG